MEISSNTIICIILLILVTILKCFNCQNANGQQYCTTDSSGNCNLNNIRLNKTDIFNPKSNENSGVIKFKITTSIVPLLKTSICDIFPHLENFLFNEVRLESIEKGVFNSCFNIKRIEMYGNRLKTLEDDVFVNNTKLETLLLYKNHFKQMKASWFDGLNSLIRLDIDRNELEEFQYEHMHSLKNLQALWLNSNKIYKINVDFIASEFPSLKHLYINDNDLACSDLNMLLDKLKAVGIQEFSSTYTYPKRIRSVAPAKINGIECLDDDQWIGRVMKSTFNGNENLPKHIFTELEKLIQINTNSTDIVQNYYSSLTALISLKHDTSKNEFLQKLSKTETMLKSLEFDIQHVSDQIYSTASTVSNISAETNNLAISLSSIKDVNTKLIVLLSNFDPIKSILIEALESFHSNNDTLKNFIKDMMKDFELLLYNHTSLNVTSDICKETYEFKHEVTSYIWLFTTFIIFGILIMIGFVYHINVKVSKNLDSTSAKLRAFIELGEFQRTQSRRY